MDTMSTTDGSRPLVEPPAPIPGQETLDFEEAEPGTAEARPELAEKTDVEIPVDTDDAPETEVIEQETLNDTDPQSPNRRRRIGRWIAAGVGVVAAATVATLIARGGGNEQTVDESKLVEENIDEIVGSDDSVPSTSGNVEVELTEEGAVATIPESTSQDGETEAPTSPEDSEAANEFEPAINEVVEPPTAEELGAEVIPASEPLAIVEDINQRRHQALATGDTELLRSVYDFDARNGETDGQYQEDLAYIDQVRGITGLEKYGEEWSYIGGTNIVDGTLDVLEKTGDSLKIAYEVEEDPYGDRFLVVDTVVQRGNLWALDARVITPFS